MSSFASASVEPGVASEPPPGDPHATARLPDYRRALRVPYRPSAADFLIPETHSGADEPNPPLWIVPVTTTQPRRWIPVRRFPFVVKASRALNLVAPANDMAADRRCHEPLVFLLRSGDLGDPGLFANFKYVIERLASYRGLRNCRFTGVEEAMTNFLQATKWESLRNLFESPHNHNQGNLLPDLSVSMVTYNSAHACGAPGRTKLSCCSFGVFVPKSGIFQA